MDLRILQQDLVGDLMALRSGAISVSQARARAVLARTVVEAEKAEIIKQQMIRSGGPVMVEHEPAELLAAE